MPTWASAWDTGFISTQPSAVSKRNLPGLNVMRYLPTPRAVEILGRSMQSLIRYARAGFLTPGVHFFKGPHQNSPITWDVERCQERFGELAMMPSRGVGSCAS